MMALTPAQAASVAKWNSLGARITDASMIAFFDEWFTNARLLIKADFPIHSVEELTGRLGLAHKTFTILGSGPSLLGVAQKLPTPHEALFCSPTALGALTREGIRPTALIVADSNPQQYMHLVESRIFRPDILDVVLPVTADPAWYGPDSILSRHRLFFYLPYMDWMGDVDIGFNHILKNLFPEVHKYISQAGSVSNLALNIADMACGEDPSKRVYIGVDCSWVKGGLTKAPLRFDLADHGKVLREAYELMQKPRSDLAEVTFYDQTIQTDLISLSYAINMFYIIHQNILERPYSAKRYALIPEASKLFRATFPNLLIPWVLPGDTAQAINIEGEEAWAYKAMLALVELSNVLLTRLDAENVKLTEEYNARLKASQAVVSGLLESPQGDDRGNVQS